MTTSPPPADASSDPHLAPPLASLDAHSTEPLAGFTVGVTAARRGEELAGLLTRRGARVVSAPAIRLVPLADDSDLLSATRACLAGPVQYALVTTGVGFTGWLEAARGWGLGAALTTMLGSAKVLARGPKARGAIRAVGLAEDWSPDSEALPEMLDHLLAADLRGQRVVVQLHGEPLPDLVAALREGGATVIEVPVYRWRLPVDPGPLRRLVGLTVLRQVDAVAFTSAPAAIRMLEIATEMGQHRELVAALRSDVVAACVGAVTAGPLEELGIATMQPARARLGALARELVAELPGRRTVRLSIGEHRLEVRGQAVVVNESLRALPPRPMAVLRALARSPGRVLSRTELLQILPGNNGTDGHAVEMAVARLRTGLGDAQLVRTVVKRGYRLDC